MSNEYFPLGKFKLREFTLDEFLMNDAALLDLLSDDNFTTGSTYTGGQPEYDEVGSLSYHCNKAVDSRIAAVTAEQVSDVLPLFSAMDHKNANYARNTECWLKDIVDQTTCFSPWNSDSGQVKAGTLVSPRHIILANHCKYPARTTVRFVDAKNQVVDRRVIAVQSVELSNSTQASPTDVAVGLLDREVSSSISFAKLMPGDWRSYLPTIDDACRVAAVGMNQFKEATVRDAIAINCFTRPDDPKRELLYKDIVNGDSGCPAFFIINNELVLLTGWTLGGGGAGPDYSSLASEINAVMTKLGGGYQLTTVDLSGFIAY